MATEFFEYVKLTQNNEGFVTVEVLNKDSTLAVQILQDTIWDLKNKDIPVPNPNDLETKADNNNTKFVPTVTVKGRGEQVVTKYLSEIARMKEANSIE